MLKLGSSILPKISGTTYLRDIINNSTSKSNAIFQCHFIRNVSFFNRISGKDLWKGVTSVSNAGKRRGRGKGSDRAVVKNLNRGQKVGHGKVNVLWPGLNTYAVQSNTVMKIQKLPERKDEEVVKERERKKRLPIHPLERGWSGRSILGRDLGPPKPDENSTYENFNCICIEHTLGGIMTATVGRKRVFRATVITGNGNGLIGLARAKSQEGRVAVEKAKNSAIKNLISFDFEKKHTINHDFFYQFGNCKLFVYKKYEGYGLKCHRAIAACCKLIGIKDLAVNCEGSTHSYNVVKCFLMGLMNQKSYQDIVDENNRYLVEFREDRLNFPEVIASPQKTLLPEKKEAKEKIDFEEYIWDNKIVYKRPKKVRFYEKLPGWQKYLRKSLYRRNRNKVKLELIKEHGEITSFLGSAYPECLPRAGQKKESNVGEVA